MAWFLNPWMLIGIAAVGLPILIHLLNRRRFKIVDWAAMDFLFQADRKNRRRVQLENLILLLLRCLAMLLIALMLARPFLPSGVTQFLQQTAQVERVVLIDDSLSQRALVDSIPGIERTKTSVLDLLSELAASSDTQNWLTVYLTSDPDQPLIDYQPLTQNVLAETSQTIDAIECSDQASDYQRSLTAIRQHVEGKRENVGRAVYVYSDLRRRDWVSTGEQDTESSPEKLLAGIADESVGTFLIDTGSDQDNNLAVTSVRPGELLVAEKVISFAVTVSNFGRDSVADVRVMFQVGEAQPQYETIPMMAGGSTETLYFNTVFGPPGPQPLTGIAQQPPLFQNFRVRAEIDRQSLGDGLASDQLQQDSQRLYAAHVREGVRVLLIDGDPSSIAQRSETHYLRSLAVVGTGLQMDVGTVSDLETMVLSDYSAIFLCNVDEASPDRIDSLTTWVDDGGALVLMPGNRVRAGTFNAAFHRDGTGLSPLELTTMSGDPTMSNWVNFEIDPQIHPALKVIVESDATSLGKVDVFSWWASEIDDSVIGKSVQVPLRLSDKNNSPAMVDRSVGDGRVIVFAIPGDGDWTMWPGSPTFAPVMIDLIDYLVNDSRDAVTVADRRFGFTSGRRFGVAASRVVA